MLIYPANNSTFLIYLKKTFYYRRLKMKENQSDQKTRVISLVLWLEQIAHIQ